MKLAMFYGIHFLFSSLILADPWISSINHGCVAKKEYKNS